MDEVRILAITPSESSPDHYVLVLEAPASQVRLPIIIGEREAKAIAMPLAQIEPVRPLTHDLLPTTLAALGASLHAVAIHSEREGVFFARLELRTEADNKVPLDCRPSDGIALAVRVGCPILVANEVLNRLGISETAPSHHSPLRLEALDQYSEAELSHWLERLLLQEDYERASRVRDALDRKRGGAVE